jgi:hypothetical protein
MRMHQVLTEGKISTQEFSKLMGDFLPLAMKELGVDSLPNIVLVAQVGDDVQPTFGKFVNNENRIYIALNERHPLDVLRTLAHELVHFRQASEHKLDADSGQTGSPAENEAHEVAGIIMRTFNKKHPNYFNFPAITLK